MQMLGENDRYTISIDRCRAKTGNLNVSITSP